MKILCLVDKHKFTCSFQTSVHVYGIDNVERERNVYDESSKKLVLKARCEQPPGIMMMMMFCCCSEGDVWISYDNN